MYVFIYCIALGFGVSIMFIFVKSSHQVIKIDLTSGRNSTDQFIFHDTLSKLLAWEIQVETT